jgi:hypothetical protein
LIFEIGLKIINKRLAQPSLNHLIGVISSNTTTPAYGLLAYLMGGYQAELAEPI